MPASFIKDESIWAKAKKAAKKAQPDDFYAMAVSIYKKMGGRIAGRGKAEAQGSQAGAALLRPKVEWAKEAKANVSLIPTAVDTAKREIRCIIISQGPGNRRDRNYYSERAITDPEHGAITVFEGARAFLNHQTQAERQARPEQDVNELAGYYKHCKAVQVNDEAGKAVWACEATLVCDPSAAGDEALAKAITAIRYRQELKDSQEVYAGISVNADGLQEGFVEIEGERWANIVGFAQARSADIVTRPARGGKFIQLLESVASDEVAGSKQGEHMNVKQLKTKILSLQESLKAEDDATKKQALEAQIADLKGQLSTAVLEAEDDKPGDKAKDDEDEEETSEADEEEDEDLEGEAFKGLAKEMKGMVPPKEDESEAEYGVRLVKAMKTLKKHAKAAKPAKQESLTFADFKTRNPKLYSQVRAHVLESAAVASNDFKAVREELREAKTELSIMKDTRTAERLLAEANISPRFLAAADLIGKDEDGMRREIARTKNMLEANRGGGLGNPQKGAGAGAGKGTTRESLEAAGLLLKK